MFSISERWVPGGRGAAKTFTIRIIDETAKMSQNECRSNRCFNVKGGINIAHHYEIEILCQVAFAGAGP